MGPLYDLFDALTQIHRRDAWGLVTEGMRSVDDGPVP